MRIHTRLPVVIPTRITPELIDILKSSRLNQSIVFHINHSNEIDQQLISTLEPLHNAGIILLNQAVLLKNINDSTAQQIALSERLFDAKVLPYYLHLLDRVAGAAHFEVTEEKARQIMNELLKELPGFLIPKLVREQAEQPSKTPIQY